MGIIFDIQRLSVHDGPGLRTTVFIKGCPLRCRWCHNPESYSRRIQLQYFEEKCIRCGKCQSLCSEGVHNFVKGEHLVDFDLCNKCGACIAECPADALKFMGKELNASQVIDIVDKDEVFIKEDGGVTFSGGEALFQPEFLYDLLKEAKNRGYHTCVDTCGFTLNENISRILPYTDCFLYDIKASDSDIHKRATGQGNELIWNNLIFLSNEHKEIHIRIPLIKEYNGQISEASDIASRLKDLDIASVTIMPYHVIGRSKRSQLGMDTGEVFITPTTEELERYKDVFRQCGLKVIS